VANGASGLKPVLEVRWAEVPVFTSFAEGSAVLVRGTAAGRIPLASSTYVRKISADASKHYTVSRVFRILSFCIGPTSASPFLNGSNHILIQPGQFEAWAGRLHSDFSRSIR
jgi:hypothetical protein